MYLRTSRARHKYTCVNCGKAIPPGTVYFRDEPHPKARYHRGAQVRHLCSGCIVVKAEEIVLPPVLLQAEIIRAGPNIDEGQLVIGVAIPWFEIIREIAKDPKCRFQIPWRKLEELIAGAYEREGWERVILTPRSGDRGRDIIVEKHGIGSIRIVDQVKAYRPDRRVKADDVRALLGVLTADPNISKGIITTTAEFAPGIIEDSQLRAFMPYRLELKSGSELVKWIVNIYNMEFRGHP